MPAEKLSPETLDDLKRRHVAFLKARLVSEMSRDDWVRAAGKEFDRLLAREIRSVIVPESIADALVRALDDESLRTFFAPVLREVQGHAVATLATENTALADYVPADAQQAIEALLEKRDLVPDALVHKIFEQQAVVDAINDTLYEGLVQFNTGVNPFFADWGLPSLLKRMPIGGGMILSSMEALRGEFDRRLEPEIRTFLSAFSRRAAGQLTELFITNSGDPKFIELRRNVAAFLYSQSLAELLAGVDEDAIHAAATVTERVMLDPHIHANVAGSARRVIEAFLLDRADSTFGDWLDEIGVTQRPDVEGWALRLWPYLAQAFASEAVGRYLDTITGEFYDGLKR